MLDELGTCFGCSVISVEKTDMGNGPEGTLEYQAKEIHFILGTLGSHGRFLSRREISALARLIVSVVCSR